MMKVMHLREEHFMNLEILINEIIGRHPEWVVHDITYPDSHAKDYYAVILYEER
jgi:hypothetical protein